MSAKFENLGGRVLNTGAREYFESRLAVEKAAKRDHPLESGLDFFGQ